MSIEVDRASGALVRMPAATVLGSTPSRSIRACSADHWEPPGYQRSAVPERTAEHGVSVLHELGSCHQRGTARTSYNVKMRTDKFTCWVYRSSG